MPCLPQSLMTFIRKAILFMVPVIVVLGLIPKAKADGISYTLTDLGSGNWEYSYTITNTDEASGLYVFDIYFPSVSSTDALNYSNITETANPDSTNWITTVFPPSAPNLGGIYDAVALNTPIALGQSLSGFSVSFNYALTKQLPVIGPQYFEIYDSNYHLLESGTTVQAAVPEASTLVLLVSGIFGLLGLLVSRRI
jgi:hypothetical protein